jgi:hypothetical protein
MNTPETKLANQIASATEDHWFNPAVIGRLLANQPIYTLDRIMEMVAQIIRSQEISGNRGGHQKGSLLLKN